MIFFTTSMGKEVFLAQVCKPFKPPPQPSMLKKKNNNYTAKGHAYIGFIRAYMAALILSSGDSSIIGVTLATETSDSDRVSFFAATAVGGVGGGLFWVV